MGFRFQNRLKLFPGVRLNFSAGGLSTTIGVPGASLTVGSRGTYVNLGLPGTGLSCRQRITPSDAKSGRVRELDASSGVTAAPKAAPSNLLEALENTPLPGAIRSGSVSTLTSTGLGEVKTLINQAAIKRVELTASISRTENLLASEQQRLQRARWFIVRLFTKRAVARLLLKVAAAEKTLADARQQHAGCAIELDFAFDQSTLSAFAGLVRTFDVLSKCQKIWDVTASVATNRFVERTIAKDSLTRKVVNLSVADSEIISSNCNALRFTNANGNDLYLYPGFVMMPSPTKDFALIDVRELQVKFLEVHFIEEEGVPSDIEVTGRTWKKTNKDGSPDRRFVSNYEIPVARYAQIEFRSSSGWTRRAATNCRARLHKARSTPDPLHP